MSQYFYLMRNINWRDTSFNWVAALGSVTAFWLAVLTVLVCTLCRWTSKWLGWTSAAPARRWALGSPPAQQRAGQAAPLVRRSAHSCGNESRNRSLAQNSHPTFLVQMHLLSLFLPCTYSFSFSPAVQIKNITDWPCCGLYWFKFDVVKSRSRIHLYIVGSIFIQCIWFHRPYI